MAVQSKAKSKLLDLTEEDIDILNSPLGLKYLFAEKKLNVMRSLRLVKYELELRRLQVELIKLQKWTIENGRKIIVLFEGRDAAGKGGAIRRLVSKINPRHFRIVALPKPTTVERGQWYFQRYISRLPKSGEMVFFDRSWYNRAVVEPVNGFCTQEEYEIFMGQVNDFERMILESNIFLVKIYFSISKEEQASRFSEIRKSPLKRWKMTPVDERAQELWEVYTEYKDRMFAVTDTEAAPWIIIDANRKSIARIEALREILDRIPYQ